MVVSALLIYIDRFFTNLDFSDEKDGDYEMIIQFRIKSGKAKTTHVPRFKRVDK